MTYTRYITIDIDSKDKKVLEYSCSVLDELFKNRIKERIIKPSNSKGYHIIYKLKEKITWDTLIQSRIKAKDDLRRIECDILRYEKGLPTQILFDKKYRL